MDRFISSRGPRKASIGAGFRRLTPAIADCRGVCSSQGLLRQEVRLHFGFSKKLMDKPYRHALFVSSGYRTRPRWTVKHTCYTVSLWGMAARRGPLPKRPRNASRWMNQDLKKTLWAAADKLRSDMDAAECKHKRETVRVKLRGMVKTLPRRYKYPADRQVESLPGAWVS